MSERDTSRRMKDHHRRMLRLNDVCHLCGHPGADCIDHIIPVDRGGPDVDSNKAPAHHTQPCPTCGLRCNRIKGNRLVPAVIRRSSSLRRQ